MESAELPPRLELLARDYFEPALAEHGFLAHVPFWMREAGEVQHWLWMWEYKVGLPTFTVGAGVVAPALWRALHGDHLPPTPAWELERWHLLSSLEYLAPSTHATAGWWYEAPPWLPESTRHVVDRARVFVSQEGPADSLTSLTRKLIEFGVASLDGITTLADLHAAMVARPCPPWWVGDFALPTLKVLLGETEGAAAWFRAEFERLDRLLRTDVADFQRTWYSSRRQTTLDVADRLRLDV